MKKFLFLLLGLAVSTTAFAGVNQRLTKAQPVQNKRTATSIKLDTRVPMVMGMAKTAQPQFALTNDRVVEAKSKGMFRAVITEQPEGTVKYYNRGGSSVYRYYDSSASSPWGSVTYGEQDGLVMTVENGNTIYIKNILYDPDGYYEDYWVEGTKSGTRINVAMGQEIMYSEYYDAYIVLGMGTLAYSSGFSFTKGSATNAVFKIGSDNSLTLQNSAYDGNYGGTCLSCYWSDDNSWGAFADFETVFTEAGDIPETPVMYTDSDIEALSGTETLYYRTGESFFYNSGIYMGSQDGYAYVFYDEDGSTVYMRNPVYGWNGGTWVKGTISGDKITVPLGQYLTWTDDFVGLKTAWGECTFPTDSTVEFTVDPSVTEITYTIAGNTITLDGTSEYVGLATVMDSAYVDYEDGWYPNLDYSTVYYTIPSTPTDLAVTPAATTADAAWVDTENEGWNLRYRPYDPNAAYYSCDFEDASEWGGLDLDGDGYWWGYRELEDGSYCLTSASWYNNTVLTPDNWLVSPAITLNGVVRFKAWGQDPSYPSEVIRVYVLPDTAYEDETAFVALSEDITVLAYDTVTPANNIYTFDLSEYAGTLGRIAIRHYNVSDMFYVNVDDFFVGDPNATVPDWITVTGVTNPYTIEGLTPETMYEVQVQGVNPGGVGEWTASTIFTTLAEGLRGDVNKDGKVNIADVTALISHLLNNDFEDSDTFSLDNADCNLDGSPTVADVTALIKFVLSQTW